MASPVIPSKVAPIRALSRSSLSVDTGPSAIVVTGRSGPGRWPATASRMCWSPAPRTMCAPTLAAASETRAAMDAAFRSPPASGSLPVTCRSPWCCAGGRSGWVSRRSSGAANRRAVRSSAPSVPASRAASARATSQAYCGSDTESGTSTVAVTTRPDASWPGWRASSPGSSASRPSRSSGRVFGASGMFPSQPAGNRQGNALFGIAARRREAPGPAPYRWAGCTR